MQSPHSRRILSIDDNPSIHEDFCKILSSSGRDESSLDAKEQVLCGARSSARAEMSFEIHSARQGEEGLECIVQARRDGTPFQLAFVDVRMPPGWDGIETIERILPADPDLQMVICSAYSDYSARDFIERVGLSDRLLLLKKPCDAAEIQLMALALCRKWELAHSAQLI